MKNRIGLLCLLTLCATLPAQAQEAVHTNHEINDLYGGAEPMPQQPDTFVVRENESSDGVSSDESSDGSSDGLWQRPPPLPPARAAAMPGSVLNGTPGATAYGDVLNGRVKDTTPKPVPAAKDLGQGDRNLHQRIIEVFGNIYPVQPIFGDAFLIAFLILHFGIGRTFGFRGGSRRCGGLCRHRKKH